MLNQIKEYWGFAMLPAALVTWLASAVNWLNSGLALVVLIITAFLAYYRMGKAKVKRDMARIELEEVRRHQRDEKWMRHWMEKRQRDKPDSD